MIVFSINFTLIQYICEAIHGVKYRVWGNYAQFLLISVSSFFSIPSACPSTHPVSGWNLSISLSNWTLPKPQELYLRITVEEKRGKRRKRWKCFLAFSWLSLNVSKKARIQTLTMKKHLALLKNTDCSFFFLILACDHLKCRHSMGDSIPAHKTLQKSCCL